MVIKNASKFRSIQNSMIFFIFANKYIITQYTVLTMSEKEIKQLKDLAKERLKKQVSRDQALHTFVMAGILDNKGRFTDNYPHLAAAVSLKSK